MPQINVADTTVHAPAGGPAVPDGARSPDSSRPGTGADPRSPAKVVLVVQDAAGDQMVARGVLEGVGYRVDFAVNGLEAVAAVTATPDRFAAVLMGCELRRLDGYEATRVIRGLEGPGVRVPIIGLNGSALPCDRERCLAAGMDDLMVKPLDFGLLERLLARWVDGVVPTGDPDHAEDLSGLLDLERVRMLQELSTGQGSFFAVCVDNFLARLPEDVAAIESAVRGADHSALVAAAHALKGSAQNLGAVEIGRLCQALEAESLDHGTAMELTSSLRLQVERTAPALRAAVAAPAT